jgi:hypothetical protein
MELLSRDCFVIQPRSVIGGLPPFSISRAPSALSEKFRICEVYSHVPKARLSGSADALCEITLSTTTAPAFSLFLGVIR